MLRSFSIVKGLMPRPSRSCRNSAGPVDVERTRHQKSSSKGAARTISSRGQRDVQCPFHGLLAKAGRGDFLLRCEVSHGKASFQHHHRSSGMGSPTSCP